MKSRVPTLSVSAEQVERDGLVELNFAVPCSKASLLKDFADENFLEISVKGTLGHAEIPESYFNFFVKFLYENHFEERFEKEVAAKRFKRNKIGGLMKNQKTKKGWREAKDPGCIGEDGEPKARRHYEVQMKGKNKDTLREPIKAPCKTGKSESDREGELTEDIVENVQSKRKPGAVAKDNSKTAKNVGVKEDAEDLVKWVKNPGEDLKGVDTAGEDQEPR